MEEICIEDGFTLLKTYNRDETAKEVFKGV